MKGTTPDTTELIFELLERWNEETALKLVNGIKAQPIAGERFIAEDPSNPLLYWYVDDTERGALLGLARLLCRACSRGEVAD